MHSSAKIQRLWVSKPQLHGVELRAANFHRMRVDEDSHTLFLASLIARRSSFAQPRLAPRLPRSACNSRRAALNALSPRFGTVASILRAKLPLTALFWMHSRIPRLIEFVCYCCCDLDTRQMYAKRSTRMHAKFSDKTAQLRILVAWNFKRLLFIAPYSRIPGHVIRRRYRYPFQPTKADCSRHRGLGGPLK